MTRAPLVDTTAVVPYWDLDPAFLTDAISSIASSVDQPRTIVVDNASSVPLPELPPWVEVLRLPSRVTVGVARNAGLERVATPWVLFLDADDMLADGTLDRWRVVAAERPGAVVVRGARHRRHGTNEVVYRHHWVARLDGHPALLPPVNTFRMCVGTSTALLRTDAVRAAGGFGDAPIEEDWVLSGPLAFHGEVVRVHGAETIRRYRPDSMTATRPEDWSRSVVARRELRRRLRRDPVVPLWFKAATPLLALLHGRPRWELVRARFSNVRRSRRES